MGIIDNYDKCFNVYCGACSVCVIRGIKDGGPSRGVGAFVLKLMVGLGVTYSHVKDSKGKCQLADQEYFELIEEGTCPDCKRLTDLLKTKDDAYDKSVCYLCIRKRRHKQGQEDLDGFLRNANIGVVSDDTPKR